ncbi:MAG: HAMP domain-containing sensor histidine kinase [Vulcanimicrobiota bacterium]
MNRLYLKLGFLGLASLGLLGLSFHQAAAAPVLTSPALLLVATYLWLESRSPGLPGLGFVSAGCAAWLPLALSPAGPRFATVVCLAVLGLRSLLRGSPLTAQRLLEGLCEALPTLASLSWMALRGQDFSNAVIACIVYVLSLVLCQNLLAGELPQALSARFFEVRGRMLLPLQASGCAGLALGLNLQASPPGLFLWLPMLACWPAVLRASARAEEDQQHGNIIRKLERQQREQEVLELANQSLLQVRTLSQTCQEIAHLCNQLAPLDCSGVFLFQAGVLKPVLCPTPIPEEGLRLLQECCRARKALSSRHSVGHCLALPLGLAGALYLARREAAFSPTEVRYFVQAAGQGGLALQIATQVENLQVWTGILSRLVGFASQFSEPADLPALQHKVARAVSDFIPHQRLEVTFQLPDDPVCQQVAQTRQAFVGPDGQGSSLMVVPICHPQLAQVGIIRLSAPPEQPFHSMHRDALWVLAGTAAAAWQNLQMQQQRLEVQVQLGQASKLAAVGQLAAGIAHEINTPLGSVMINLDLTLRNHPEEKRLLKAKEMVQFARDIIEKLLLFSRQASHFDQREEWQLAQVVDDGLALFSQSLSHLQLRREVIGNPRARVCAGEIQQVLLNLLLNAADAIGPSSTSEILVSLEELGNQAVLRVADRGPGIAPENLEKIFDPFFTTKPIGQGTGLGLAVCRQIAEAHQGRLEVESQAGLGTRFSLWLPGLSEAAVT